MRLLGFVVAVTAVLGVTGSAIDTENCPEDFNCFSNLDSFNDFDKEPESAEDVGVEFLIYTRKNRLSGNVLSLANRSAITDTHFNSELKVKVVIHGYLGSATSSWVTDMKDALLEKENINVLLVDWRKGAGINYLQSAANTRTVAAALKCLLNQMVYKGVSWNDIHLIGFSLGAHISGMIGHCSGSQLGRISGLDPADPQFQDMDLSIRLDKTDAKFVDVIHTNMKSFWLITGFGTSNPSGHVDFYPNGGERQPGCTLSVGCSHSRAHDLYLDSIKYPSSCLAFPCPSYEKFEDGSCTECGTGGCSQMGYHADKYKGRGGFYLDTQEESPFCSR